MNRKPPPSSGPATSETIEDHIRVGSRWLAAAAQQYPELSVEEAMIEVQKCGGKLDRSTVGRYRGDLKYGLIDHLECEGRSGDFDVIWPELNRTLSARGAKIPEKDWRTSALKVKDATEEEARTLFNELKQHSQKYGNPNAIFAALFVLVAGHAGFRPIELLGATLTGDQLTLPNAKRRPGLNRTRTIDISKLHEDAKIGIKLMLGCIDQDMTKREFAKWEKTIAGQMSRACKRLKIRILSLYSFRHIAIASWSAAGLPPAEIARLCGHISIRTAHTHYSRKAAGHKRKAVVSSVQMQLDTEPTSSTGAPAISSEVELNDMPVPATGASEPKMSVEEIANGLTRFTDERSANEIGLALRNARVRREVSSAVADRPLPVFKPEDG